MHSIYNALLSIVCFFYTSSLFEFRIVVVTSGGGVVPCDAWRMLTYADVYSGLLQQRCNNALCNVMHGLVDSIQGLVLTLSRLVLF
jgi:hypothetical protein